MRDSRHSSLPWREGKREGDYYKTSPSPNLSLLRERNEEDYNLLSIDRDE